jgi:hypothetical protein
MPWLLDHRRKLKTSDIDERLVRGSWRRLVYAQPPAADGVVGRNAYVFCVLTQFHRASQAPRHLRAPILPLA